MSFDTDTLNETLRKARAGDYEAAARLVREYGRSFLRIFRYRYKQRLKQLERVVGGSDLTQEAWVALIMQQDGLSEQTFASPEHFMAFLQGVARNKLREAERRYLGTEKRDLTRQAGFRYDL